MHGCAAREAVGPEGQAFLQQWLAHTSARYVDKADRRRLHRVVYGATLLGGEMCCDVRLVSPLTREGRFRLSAAASRGVLGLYCAGCTRSWTFGVCGHKKGALKKKKVHLCNGQYFVSRASLIKRRLALWRSSGRAAGFKLVVQA